MKKIALVALLLMAACEMSWDTLKRDMPSYAGQPIERVVARIGMPRGEQTVMGRKAYIWQNGFTSTDVIPTTTTGYVGTTPVQMTTYNTQSTQLACTFRVFVNSENRVSGWDVTGNNGACQTYADRLRVEH